MEFIFSKSITYIHDIAFVLYPEFVEERNLHFLNKHVQLWLSRTDKIVTVSQSSKSEIEEYFKISNVDVIQNAEEVSMKRQSDKKIQTIRKKYGLNNNYFLYLGNIEPRKNLLNMIEGFKEFAVTNPNFDLLIIGGDGWKNEDVLIAIDSLRSQGVRVIRPKDYVPDDDIPSLISGAEAVLQLSWHEGFGLSVLHSIACGTPVIASDIPALNEISDITGSRIVKYVNPEDTNQIASAMKEISNKPKEKLENIHIPSWEEAAAKLHKIIKQL